MSSVFLLESNNHTRPKALLWKALLWRVAPLINKVQLTNTKTKPNNKQKQQKQQEQQQLQQQQKQQQIGSALPLLDFRRASQLEGYWG